MDSRDRDDAFDDGADDDTKSKLPLQLGVAALVVVVALVVALVVFKGGGGASACPDIGRSDSAYAAELVSPAPRMGQQTYELAITRSGSPIEGAVVCLGANMSDDMSVDGKARALGPGRYEVDVDFNMEGRWDGIVLVTEGSDDPVSIPLSIEVPK